MEDERLYLVLGCFGRKENGFVLCPSTENRILPISESISNFEKLLNYLNQVKLFDKQMLDNNGIRNFIFNLQDKYDEKIKRLWNDHEYNLIERFMNMHKPCGLYCKLILVPKEFEEEIEEEQISFIIKPQNSIDIKNTKKLIV